MSIEPKQLNKQSKKVLWYVFESAHLSQALWICPSHLVARVYQPVIHVLFMSLCNVTVLPAQNLKASMVSERKFSCDSERGYVCTPDEEAS